MAAAVTSQVIHYDQQSNKYAIRLTNVSDASDESAVIKVDISTLNVRGGYSGAPVVPCTYTVIEKIEYSVSGMVVTLLWDHTADDKIAVLGGVVGTYSGCLHFTKVGGIIDPRTAGGTGDILLTTAGGGVGDTYDITLYLKLKA